MHYLITGASGYVGRRTITTLLTQTPPPHIIAVDRTPFPTPHPNITPITGDITSNSTLDHAFASFPPHSPSHPRVVLHLASYGMSGPEQVADEALVAAINVDATQQLLSRAKAAAVSVFVYVSTYNAVFHGQTLPGVGSGSTPLAPVQSHPDPYSRTKTRAESLVRSASSSLPGEMLTLALRPAAIYGDGETRHLPRILDMVRAGLAYLPIGSPDVLCDWVYVDNLVHALSCAVSAGCNPVTRPDVSAAAFFVSDNYPINNFVFLQTLFAAAGIEHSFSSIYLPTNIAYALAYLIEQARRGLIWVSGGRFSFTPILTRAEVNKVGVTHYATLHREMRLLGYTPIVPFDQAVAKTGAALAVHAPSIAHAQFLRTKRLDTIALGLGFTAFIGCFIWILLIVWGPPPVSTPPPDLSLL